MTVVMEANRQLKREGQADFCVLLDFSLTVKAAPHECVIWPSQPKAQVKAEKEARFYSQETVSSCATTSVII